MEVFKLPNSVYISEQYLQGFVAGGCCGSFEGIRQYQVTLIPLLVLIPCRLK